MTDKIVVISTCGSLEEAESLARLLVEGGSAACVNILAPVRSIYRWQAKVEDTQEWMLLIKTSQSRFDEVAEAVRAAHSYEVPEIIALPIVSAAKAYLDWLSAQTGE